MKIESDEKSYINPPEFDTLVLVNFVNHGWQCAKLDRIVTTLNKNGETIEHWWNLGKYGSDETSDLFYEWRYLPNN